MKIDNEFTVSVPIERAWEVLTDLEGIAPCMPGAQLTGVEGDVYSGKVRVKVGPVVSEYAGTVRFLEKDDADHRAVIDAKGRDSRGAGNASAAITAHLRADGPRTVVSVDTDLKISGKVAQLGSGMIKEVSNKLLGQFVACLEAKLTAEPETPAPAAAPPTEADVAADPAPDAALASEPAPDPDPAPASTPAPATDSASTLASAPGPGPVPDLIPAPSPAASASASSAEADASGTEAGRDVRPETGDRPVPDAPVPDKPTADGPTAEMPIAEVPTVETSAAEVPVSRVITPDVEPEPLDLLGVAGGAVYKRLIPLVIGIVVVIVVVVVIWAVVS